MYKVLAIVGPTAVGKSDAAIKLAKRYQSEVINGDSIQVYRKLNIGSAKITTEEMQGINHRLLDYKNVGEDYDVHTFQIDARKEITSLINENKLPIICGGTGLYIKALLYDYEFVENTQNVNNYDDVDTQTLYERLLKIDNKASEKIHPNNRRRIVRALQIAESGQLKSEQEANQQHEPIYDSLVIGLTMPRELLHQRIAKRVDMMFNGGLLEEVQQLNVEYDWSMHGLHGIGYKEFKDYFAGTKTLPEVKKEIITHTNQFAKRQYTWWNNQMDVKWFDVTNPDYMEDIYAMVDKWMEK